MKKLLALSLLTVILYSTIGFFPAFIIGQRNVKKEMRELISNLSSHRKTVDFIFSGEEFAACYSVEENEINLKANYFDVIGISPLPGGMVRVVCIIDNEETGLFAGLLDQDKKNSDPSSNGKQSQNTIKFFSSEFFTNEEIKLSLTEKNNLYFQGTFYPLSPGSLQNPSPPPRVA